MARRQYKGKIRTYDSTILLPEYVRYVNVANLFKLTCDLNSIVGYPGVSNTPDTNTVVEQHNLVCIKGDIYETNILGARYNMTMCDKDSNVRTIKAVDSSQATEDFKCTNDTLLYKDIDIEISKPTEGKADNLACVNGTLYATERVLETKDFMCDENGKLRKIIHITNAKAAEDLRCDSSGRIGSPQVITDTNKVTKYIKKQYNRLSKTYHPDKKNSDECVVKLTEEKDWLLNEIIKTKDFSSLVCEGATIKEIEDKYKDVGNHRIFSYCDYKTQPDTTEYEHGKGFFKENFLSHEVAWVNKILNIDFEALDPTLQEHAMGLAAALEEFEGHH